VRNFDIIKKYKQLFMRLNNKKIIILFIFILGFSVAGVLYWARFYNDKQEDNKIFIIKDDKSLILWQDEPKNLTRFKNRLRAKDRGNKKGFGKRCFGC